MKKLDPKHSAGSFAPSELPVNADGSIYHLALKPEQVADTVIVVGDPARVKKISDRFDSVEHRVSHREFTTHTGYLGKKRISALSTGIGTDNIDIVINELDALRSVDFEKRALLDQPKPLEIIRIGTSGALRPEIDPGTFIHSRYAIGLDGVMHYYQDLFEEEELALASEFSDHVDWALDRIHPYAVKNSPEIGKYFEEGFYQGITATACGFYGPQGRALRLPLKMDGLNERMGKFSFKEIPMANYEMESSALFALGGALGHHCTTVCLVVANRPANKFLPDYSMAMDNLIATVLERLGQD